MRYRQCKFRRGPERTVAWIEERGAKLGARVDLLTLDTVGVWEVETVMGAPLVAEALKEMQDNNHNAFASLRTKGNRRAKE